MSVGWAESECGIQIDNYSWTMQSDISGIAVLFHEICIWSKKGKNISTDAILDRTSRR